LLSSTEAFARSLKVHRQTAQRQWDKAEGKAEAAGGTDEDGLLFTRLPDAADA